MRHAQDLRSVAPHFLSLKSGLSHTKPELLRVRALHYMHSSLRPFGAVYTILYIGPSRGRFIAPKVSSPSQK